MHRRYYASTPEVELWFYELVTRLSDRASQPVQPYNTLALRSRCYERTLEAWQEVYILVE